MVETSRTTSNFSELMAALNTMTFPVKIECPDSGFSKRFEDKAAFERHEENAIGNRCIWALAKEYKLEVTSIN